MLPRKDKIKRGWINSSSVNVCDNIKVLVVQNFILLHVVIYLSYA